MDVIMNIVGFNKIKTVPMFESMFAGREFYSVKLGHTFCIGNRTVLLVTQ